MSVNRTTAIIPNNFLVRKPNAEVVDSMTTITLNGIIKEDTVVLHNVTTITLDELKSLANKKNKMRKAAMKALTDALRLQKEGNLGSVTIDRELRKFTVHSK